MKRKLICRALTVLLPFLLKLSAAPPQVKKEGAFSILKAHRSEEALKKMSVI